MKRLPSIVLLIIATGMLAYLLLPVFEAGRTPSRPRADMPWQITPTTDGSITVFGFTLGKSTLRDAVDKLGRSFELGLFRDPDERLSLEAYYKSAMLGGLSVRLVLIADLSQAALHDLLTHSGEGKRLSTRTEQYPLADADIAIALAAPIAALTYIPYAEFDRELIRQHFGEPAERFSIDSSSDNSGHSSNIVSEHWLYPVLGLGVSLSQDAGTVLQYLPPRDFERLRKLLTSPSHAQDGE